MTKIEDLIESHLSESRNGRKGSSEVMRHPLVNLLMSRQLEEMMEPNSKFMRFVEGDQDGLTEEDLKREVNMLISQFKLDQIKKIK